MVAGLKGKEYAERCMELGLETLEERRQKQDMALVYKMTQDAQMTSMFEKARSKGKDKTGHSSSGTGCPVCPHRYQETFIRSTYC
jgi:hypothetical protein